MSNAGDINGDGRDDLIISAPLANPNGADSGQTYVVFGSSSPFTSSLSSLNGSNGFALNGINASDSSGSSVKSAGDINGDGRDDLIIGAPNADSNGVDSGQSYVVFGSTSPFASSLNLSTLNGSNGFALNGISGGDLSGFSVSSAGDFNSDGADDFIIGAPGEDFDSWVDVGSGYPSAYPYAYEHVWVNGDSGQSYVVLGSTTPFASSVNLSSINGFALNGSNVYDLSGFSVSSAGDFNGDGTDDLIIGAKNAGSGHWVARGSDDYGYYYYYSKHRRGESYVVFGQDPRIEGDNNNNLLNGTFLDDKISGLGGNDTLNGGSGNDTLNGGQGFDTLNGGTDNDFYVVGNNKDIVQETSTISSEIDTVESSITYTLGSNLENLTLTVTANVRGIGNNLNNLIIGNSGNNFLDGGSGNDTLNGGSGNDTLDGGIGNESLDGGTGNDTYVIDSLAAVVQETDTAIYQIDTVESSINYTLGSNLENLALTGTADLQGTGNIGDNLLKGAEGNDTLNGGKGNDSLDGAAGNDSLDGGGGRDTLNGGAGNDTYLVDTTIVTDTDIIVETNTITTEIDLVRAIGSYTLSANLENIVLLGSSDVNGTGNNLHNFMTGNTGNNLLDGSLGNDTISGWIGNDTLNGGKDNDRLNGDTGNDSLDGGGGQDTLNGGAGNDTYLVDTTIVTDTDIIVETNTITTEIDLVKAIGSYTLVANLENIVLLGSSDVNGTGNNSHNFMTGNTGNNLLDGSLGNDTISGWIGNDILKLISTRIFMGTLLGLKSLYLTLSIG